jgi:hypothetical protein
MARGEWRRLHAGPHSPFAISYSPRSSAFLLVAFVDFLEVGVDDIVLGGLAALIAAPA